MRRALGAYMSQRDLQQMFIKSIEAEDITDSYGIPFQIFYGPRLLPILSLAALQNFVRFERDKV